METTQKSLIPGWIGELEARELLGNCKNTKLWKLRKSGCLTYSKIGNKTFYKLSSILELVEANAVKALN